MQTYLKVENLLVPICQLVPQSLDLSGGWIQLRIQCLDHLQGGEKKNSSEYESDYCFQTRIKKEKKSHHSHCELSPGTFCTSLPWPSSHHPSSSEQPSAHPVSRHRVKEEMIRFHFSLIVRLCINAVLHRIYWKML